MYVVYSFVIFIILILPNCAKAQIEESVSYIDSLITSRYTCVTTFYSTDEGFTLTENKTYKANNLVEYKAVIGTIISIDTDSIFYGKSNNQKIWIKLQTVRGENFDYSYSLRNKNKYVKYKQSSIKTYVIKLPESKAKTFLKTLW